MEKKTLVFVILRAIRLLFLVIILALIASGAGGREICSGFNYEVHATYPITDWNYYKHFPGQYFPFVTSLVVFIITVVLFAILFSNKNVQGQNRQAIFFVNLISAILIFVAACVESWFAAGGSEHIKRVDHTLRPIYCSVFRVNAWIAAVVFFILTLIDLVLDAIFSRKNEIAF